MFGSSLLERVRKSQASLAFGGLAFALLVFAVSGCYFVRKSNFAKAEERFQMRADRIAAIIEMSLDGYTRTLLGVEGLFEVYPNARRSDFRMFVEALDIEGGSPGIFALGYIERVTPSERFSYERGIRAEGYADFKIAPATTPDDAYFAKYVFVNEQEAYPKPGTFDFLSDPVRRTAIETARDSGLRTATPPVVLRGGAGERRGFTVFAPVYAGGKLPETLEERQARLQGIASIAFKADVFFPSALRGSPIPEKMRLYVKDASASLVGASDLYLHDADLDLDKALKTERTIDAAGRPWTLSFAAPRDFGMSKLERVMPWVFLVRGLLLAIMLPVCVYVLMRWWARVKTSKSTPQP